ncbi:MAG: D-threitol dehydrogenase [Clostridiales Family XIII bacterium]|jgi:NAD(P)-dependent dehydrogenase (short-subunit alcohol dehydrogenase family)|nr:D-threitol dehydrogenase [Clostridiales Family XIII bacterium]
MTKYNGITLDGSLSGKTAIVTGGANGIGLATAGFFIKKGAHVVLADLHPDVTRIAEELADDAFGMQGDVRDEAFLESVVVLASKRYGSADILVNSAGVVALERAESLSDEAWERTLSINLKGTFLAARVFANALIRAKRAGSIVNIASQAGVVAIDRHAAYTSSKGGVIALTKSLALEWARHGIRVNAVSPTYVRTDEFMATVDWQGAEGAALLERIPAGRFAEPEEVAALVAFLASDNAAMITGQNILLDGGYTIQ